MILCISISIDKWANTVKERKKSDERKNRKKEGNKEEDFLSCEMLAILWPFNSHAPFVMELWSSQKYTHACFSCHF